MKIRWRNLFQWVLASFFLLAATAFLLLWHYFRGTPNDIGERSITPASVLSTSTSPQIIRIWAGAAPGSENWTQHESSLGEGSGRIIRNVVNPTLTAYFPPPGESNGTAMIVCPGGGFHILSVANEGVDVARYLNSLGITAFVLEYRLTETNAAFPFVMMHRIKTPGGLDSVLRQMTPLILADGEQAMRMVRAHAAQWGLAPGHIGIIGFSAGGYLALNMALHSEAGARPDFVAAIYPLAPTPLMPPPSNIPLFTLCARDDPLVSPSDNSMRVYDTWHAANIPAEIHVFEKGGHGFGMRKQNLPVDAWPQLFDHWLQAQGYLPALVDPKKTTLRSAVAISSAANSARGSIQ